MLKQSEIIQLGQTEHYTFGAYIKRGHHIDLTIPLARYHFTCPYCEKKTFGRTNPEDPNITIRCKCGGSIDLCWVPKAKEYRN